MMQGRPDMQRAYSAIALRGVQPDVPCCQQGVRVRARCTDHAPTAQQRGASTG